jgi:hypothetical protein
MAKRKLRLSDDEIDRACDLMREGVIEHFAHVNAQERRIKDFADANPNCPAEVMDILRKIPAAGREIGAEMAADLQRMEDAAKWLKKV